ncbi:hypothetical protein N7481_001389 [Penicillium waksmanii]|uniref:uncharacterized protein n=1 Tax=Penicillium waksmanii TaxID=69791 RepID=UPI0025489B09|nr:uncharacterized protein N7481_001389 [Penicillium waksmanii]KAJ6000980.1 hypothetical protein N7481_001389 [Penicillium waksmanii]
MSTCFAIHWAAELLACFPYSHDLILQTSLEKVKHIGIVGASALKSLFQSRYRRGSSRKTRSECIDRQCQFVQSNGGLIQFSGEGSVAFFVSRSATKCWFPLYSIREPATAQARQGSQKGG